MELLFDERERKAVLERYRIDLQEYTDTLIFLEYLDEENIYKLFNRNFDKVNDYLSRINRVDSQPCSSLFYYFGECQKTFVGKRRNAETNDKRNMALIKSFLCSAYNYICFLVTEATFNRHAKTVVVFEACPRDLPTIKSRDEARLIKNKAKINKTNCLLSFGTNINTFKYICNKYKIDYLHFIGHGEGNGDLAIVGNDGFCRLLTFKTFENYFQENYCSSYHPKTILSCYFNSCFSDKFIYKMNLSPSMQRVFKYKIGHIGENDDDLAIKSATSFYEKVFYTNAIQFSFNYSKNVILDYRDEYARFYARHMLLC